MPEPKVISFDVGRLIIDTIPALAWSALPDGSVDFLNQRWLEYTGLSLEQGLGLGGRAAFHPEALPRLGVEWRSAILICVSLTPSAVGQWRARYDGREVGVTRAIPFATTYIDLKCGFVVHSITCTITLPGNCSRGLCWTMRNEGTNAENNLKG